MERVLKSSVKRNESWSDVKLEKEKKRHAEAMTNLEHGAAVDGEDEDGDDDADDGVGAQPRHHRVAHLRRQRVALGVSALAADAAAAAAAAAVVSRRCRRRRRRYRRRRRRRRHRRW